MPVSGMVVGVLGLSLTGALMVYFGVRFRNWTVPRNLIYGLRTQSSMASDEAWRAAHLASWRWMVASGGCLMVGALGLLILWFWVDSETVLAAWTLTSCVACVIPLIAACVVGNRAAKEVTSAKSGLPPIKRTV